MNGLNLLNGHLEKLKTLCNDAGYKKNKAKVLMDNNARSTFFHLEALCRIYRADFNKKEFNKLYQQFKSFEDVLGDIDHAEHSLQLFGKGKGFPVEIKRELTIKKNIAIANFKTLLDSTSFDVKYLETVVAEIENYNWPNELQQQKHFIKFFMDELSEMNDAYSKGEYNLALMEEGVHELRRDIRWLSIYAVVCQGMLQLRAVKNIYPGLDSYCTQAIMQSPYNQFPKPEKGAFSFTVDAPDYYALSWIIYFVGQVKDDGLAQEAFKEAKKLSANKSYNLEKGFWKILPQPGEAYDIVQNACDDIFIKHRILKRLKRSLAQALNTIKA